MALSFPTQPQTPGTPYEAPNGVIYVWDGVKWNASGTPGTGNNNLGNLYVVDQTISGLNETQPIRINANLFASEYNAYIGIANGFAFYDTADGALVSGLVHSGISNRLNLQHSGNNGVSIEANGSVLIANLQVESIDSYAIFQKQAKFNHGTVGNSYTAYDGLTNGFRFSTAIGGALPTAVVHDSVKNQIKIIHEGNVGIAVNANGSLETSNISVDGVTLSTEAGTLYVDGIAVGGAGFASELVAGDYNVTLYPNGNTIIPGTISSTATGIPEFNSSTDLNLTAANRVNIVNSPLNLGSVIPSNIIGKPGDIIYHPALQEIQAYINGAWENLLRTAENQNVRLPQGGAYQRADGVRAAWFTDLPTDISQLTDNNNLLTSQSITLQNIDIDGGGAYSIYETGLLFADGGFGSSRFGPSDTVFDGAGAGSGYTNSLNGGGA